MKNLNKKSEQSKATIKALLSQWDAELPKSIIEKQKKISSRRLFLGQSIGLMGSLTLSSAVVAKIQDNSKVFNTLKQPWISLSEVQEHLFPRIGDINIKGSEFSPGAKDINAIQYLQTMLSTPDADSDESKFIIKGVEWLDGVANSMANRPFKKLDYSMREKVLKKISASESGENWLSMLLRYIFEALLADPVYGGNTNSMGWKWLEHQPGFPRPPEDKKYWMLKGKGLA